MRRSGWTRIEVAAVAAMAIAVAVVVLGSVASARRRAAYAHVRGPAHALEVTGDANAPDDGASVTPPSPRPPRPRRPRKTVKARTPAGTQPADAAGSSSEMGVDDGDAPDEGDESMDGIDPEDIWWLEQYTRGDEGESEPMPATPGDENR